MPTCAGALNSCTSLEGIILQSPITPECIQTDTYVINLARNEQPVDILEDWKRTSFSLLCVSLPSATTTSRCWRKIPRCHHYAKKIFSKDKKKKREKKRKKKKRPKAGRSGGNRHRVAGKDRCHNEKVATYARQLIIRESNITERRPVTRCNLINSVRSDNNLHGFTKEAFPTECKVTS
ncbi:MAG: hypothetical protein LBE71_03140 [Dysgonamonadaceae bacterium]|nr:hypothetical protein [Dysgonamonadaceae bacterium]